MAKTCLGQIKNFVNFVKSVVVIAEVVVVVVVFFLKYYRKNVKKTTTWLRRYYRSYWGLWNQLSLSYPRRNWWCPNCPDGLWCRYQCLCHWMFDDDYSDCYYFYLRLWNRCHRFSYLYLIYPFEYYAYASDDRNHCQSPRHRDQNRNQRNRDLSLNHREARKKEKRK